MCGDYQRERGVEREVGEGVGEINGDRKKLDLVW